MEKKFSVLVEKDEDGYYVATVPSLPGCHTQAKSLDSHADLMHWTCTRRDEDLGSRLRGASPELYHPGYCAGS